MTPPLDFLLTPRDTAVYAVALLAAAMLAALAVLAAPALLIMWWLNVAAEHAR